MAAARFIRTWILLLTVRGSLCRAYKDLSCSQGTGADVAVVVAVALLSDRHLLDQRVWWRAGQSLHLDPLFPLRRIARKHMQQLHLSKPRIDGRGPCDAAAEVPLDGIGCHHSMTDARGCHVPWICNGETSTSPKRLSREKLVRRKIGRWLLRAHFTSGLLNNLVERTLAGRDTIRNCREKEAEPSPCLAVVPQYGECGFTSLQRWSAWTEASNWEAVACRPTAHRRHVHVVRGRAPEL
jgi:hypothetical protein